MEYVWPARRDRIRLESSSHTPEDHNTKADTLLHHATGHQHLFTNRRQSADDASSFPQKKRYSADGAPAMLRPDSRRLTSSRSFTDLRGISRQNSMKSAFSVSPDYLTANRSISEFPSHGIEQRTDSAPTDFPLDTGIGNDAAEMKTRSAQKTFVHVRISR